MMSTGPDHSLVLDGCSSWSGYVSLKRRCVIFNKEQIPVSVAQL